MRNPTYVTDLDRLTISTATSVPHHELAPFVQKYMFVWTWITLAYWTFNVLILGAVIAVATAGLSGGGLDWFEDVFIGLGTGFFLTILIAFFIHETIHLAAYKLLGAKHVALRFKNMMFLALSNDIVLDRRQFYFLAILPFAVLTPIMIAAAVVTQGFWQFVSLGILLLHTAGCSGDFALINYFYVNRDKNILTYDDVDRQVSHFYEVADPV